MLINITADPVMDAERFDSMMANQERSREHKTCAFCGYPIYREDGRHHGDTYYEIDGVTVCDNCVMDYIERFKRTFS